MDGDVVSAVVGMGARIVFQQAPLLVFGPRYPNGAVYALPPMSSPSGPSGLVLKGVDVGPDLVRGAQGLGLVEVAGEADFVAGLDAPSPQTLAPMYLF